MLGSSLSLDIGSGTPLNIASYILSNAVTATNTTTPQTLLTIPAGRTWVGSIALAATNSAASGATAIASISTAGTGVTPAAGALLKVHCSTVGTTAGLASQNNEIGPVTVVAPTGNSVTLTLTNSTATTFTSDATAVGALL
jgi:hypothetical protein